MSINARLCAKSPRTRLRWISTKNRSVPNTVLHCAASLRAARCPSFSNVLERIPSRQEGLIILSGSRRDGILSRTLENEGQRAARKLAAQCKTVFGPDRLFVEIQRSRVRGDLAASRALIDIAADLQLGVVASGNVQYHVRSLHR